MVTFSTALATSRAGGRGRVPDRGELLRFNHYMKRFGAMHVGGAKEYAKIGGRAPWSINTSIRLSEMYWTCCWRSEYFRSEFRPGDKSISTTCYSDKIVPV